MIGRISSKFVGTPFGKKTERSVALTGLGSVVDVDRFKLVNGLLGATCVNGDIGDIGDIGLIGVVGDIGDIGDIGLIERCVLDQFGGLVVIRIRKDGRVLDDDVVRNSGGSTSFVTGSKRSSGILMTSNNRHDKSINKI